MRAIVRDVYGGPDVLRVEEVPIPQATGDKVLVRVRAAGVDRGVWHLMTGMPRVVRVALGLRRPRQRQLGMDLAGVVEAVGPQVSGVRPGDRVYGAGVGAIAEFAVAKAKLLAPAPANLTFEQAAALPTSGTTALQMIRDAGKVQPGHRVLIIGAGGGVGSYAVQLAKAFGAHVTGVCSTSKVDFVRALGADEVVDYTVMDPLSGAAGRYDVILDIAGNRPLSLLRRAIGPTGALVLVGGEEGGAFLGGLERNLQAKIAAPWTKQKLRAPISLNNQKDLQTLRDLAEAGTLTPAVAKAYPLEDAAQAIADLEAGRVAGKAVVSVSG
ncbi:MAG: NAD(P)-dependent alcohol dehydrogenase [Hamadaea sp.]|nr:NAD(P)-dependent alcohol dehydrogenase [Hamadaea sp.]